MNRILGWTSWVFLVAGVAYIALAFLILVFTDASASAYSATGLALCALSMATTATRRIMVLEQQVRDLMVVVVAARTDDQAASK